jgi:hypothetical protein
LNQKFDSTVEVQARKPQQVNWEYVEILAFMQTKKAKHEEMMAEVDNWHKFQTSVTRWRNISVVIMKVGCSEHKNGPTCKDKWSTISSNFKNYIQLHGEHWTKSRLLGHECARKKQCSTTL